MKGAFGISSANVRKGDAPIVRSPHFHPTSMVIKKNWVSERKNITGARYGARVHLISPIPDTHENRIHNMKLPS